MFTGIIEETGTIKNINNKRASFSIIIEAKKIIKDLQIGDSVAVNGVCLTVKSLNMNLVNFDVMPATIKDTNLKNLKIKETINLERAAKINSRLGGHLVSGHVDTVGLIKKITKNKDLFLIKIEYPPKFTDYLIEKGSIAVDGISLTVQKVDKNSFETGIIKHTLENTNLKNKKINDKVNLEFDQIAKYTKKLLSKNSENKPKYINKYMLG